MPNWILKQFTFLYGAVSIFLTASASGHQSVSCNLTGIKSSGSFEFVDPGLNSQHAEPLSPRRLVPSSDFVIISRLDISTGGGPAPTSAIEQMPGIMGALFPDLDFGKKREYRYAQGGQATVIIPKDGKHVLRVVPNAEQAEVVQRQAKEQEVVARLREKGLSGRMALPIHERIIEANGRTFVVQAFEKYEGSLSDLYKTDRFQNLGYAEKVKLAAELAETVRQMHAASLFHLDLKSDNILYRIKPDGGIELAIADIGLMRDPQTSSNDGSIRGTPFYISPTAVGGNVKDPRNDLYPLGVVFQELMTGHLVREAAKSEEGRTKSPLLPGPASDTAIFEWLLRGGKEVPSLPAHVSPGQSIMPVHTRITFPYVEETSSIVNPKERTSRENLAVLGWFPFRGPGEMTAATAEAAKNPETFAKKFVSKVLVGNSLEGSSYNWSINGPHIVQAMLSNDVFGGWVLKHAGSLPLEVRQKLVKELKQVLEAVQLADKPGANGKGEVGAYRIENHDGPPAHFSRLYITNREVAFNIWFGRLVNGHHLEELIHSLEAQKP